MLASHTKLYHLLKAKNGSIESKKYPVILTRALVDPVIAVVSVGLLAELPIASIIE
jgi:hypothetical protein